MDVLPVWDDGAVALLSTGAGPPHAIPVSTALRVDDHTVVLALALRRESLARLRAEPAVALTLCGPGVSCTAHATATIAEEPLRESERVAAVRLDVHAVQDHLQPAFVIEDGVRWRWTDPEAARRDEEIRAALRRVAGLAR